ncbi:MULTISPECIES: hypothetical protein [Halorubrum]|jgi:hypothetical protein|uniref:Uncharacterized protein n=1 Tax=Halorubrum tropicale TaxID=1765655 RepID=A0A0N0UB04_9EURY|nr:MULTISPECIES: hypothetical protein [Halorubrum]KOX97590.1 hypothetical protein AMR74_01425 [Halorubrum tropicale]RLM50778.1 hypothetical protein DVK06_07660 [Halorubrum sp. Atlit-28R]TKX43343.1 hypothetical protein EXE50_10770 [Halorubrum sp. ARQ200]TKX49830.1 hypothetical protein EXE49_09930 [Halorubrum sp. ASP121]TKX58028.1 hypothetical protein EXE48_17205 [Halorubrum sp. ASP1]
MVAAPRPRNRRGEPIDPVPFLVTTGLAFTLVFSFGPLYGLAYGLSLPLALAASAVGFAAVALVAHRRLVRSAPPVDAGPLPSGQRFERLLYAGVGLGVAFLALTLPLL